MRIRILLLAIGITACGRPNSVVRYQQSEKQILANEIRGRVADHLERETNLHPCGTIGQMLNEIQVLGLSFFYYQPVDIMEGRKLAMKAVEAMLKEVNQETCIHPYLVRYPFRPENIEIHILVRSSDGKDVPSGNLWSIEASDGNLYYQIHKAEGRGLTTIYKETYEEALERLADPSLPLVPFQPDPQISQEELARLRKGISFVSNEGEIWHLDKNGQWIKGPRESK